MTVEEVVKTTEIKKIVETVDKIQLLCKNSKHKRITAARL